VSEGELSPNTVTLPSAGSNPWSVCPCSQPFHFPQPGKPIDGERIVPAVSLLQWRSKWCLHPRHVVKTETLSQGKIWSHGLFSLTLPLGVCVSMEELQPTSGTHHRATLENSVCSKHPGPTRNWTQSNPLDMRTNAHPWNCTASTRLKAPASCTGIPCPLSILSAALNRHKTSPGGTHDPGCACPFQVWGCSRGGLCGGAVPVGLGTCVPSGAGGGNAILPVLVPIRRMWGCAQACRGPWQACVVSPPCPCLWSLSACVPMHSP
jgi:hypothetical protein